MKAKITCRALLLSALSFLLCVSMLIGTTFAWFTDSVTSGRNTIQAGNLDVVLEYWDTVQKKYVEVDSNTKLFNDAALWEPGYTEVAYLKVSNAGSLALKYQLAIGVYNEILGKTEAGADIKLSDYLQFKVVESNTDLVGTYASREAAQAADAIATKLQAYNSEIKPLEVKNEAGDNNYYDYIALIIYMPTTVGNAANHDGTNVPKIEMGINLYATQDTVEADSFNNQYDKDAELPIVASTDEELIEALANGGIISLSNDIALPNTTTVIDKDVTIELNGNSLDASASTSRPFDLANGAKLTIVGSDETVKVGAYGLVNIPATTTEASLVLEGGSYVGNTDNGSFIKPRGTGKIDITLNNVNYTDTSAKNYIIDASSFTGDPADLNIAINGGSFDTVCGITAGIGNFTAKGATIKAKIGAFEAGKFVNLTVENCDITLAGGAFNNNTPNACVAVSKGGQATVTNCRMTSDFHIFAIYSETTSAITATGCTMNVTGTYEALKAYTNASVTQIIIG